MWDLMDDADNTYKQSSLTPNDAINLNEDPMDATKVMQDFNVEQGTNVDDTWMFEPIPFTHIPTPKVIRSYIELMQKISGDYVDPIKLNATTTLPINPTSTLPTCQDATMPLSNNTTMPLLGQKEVPPSINPPTNSPTPTSINKYSNIPKTQNGKSSGSTWVKKKYFYAIRAWQKQQRKGVRF